MTDIIVILSEFVVGVALLIFLLWWSSNKHGTVDTDSAIQPEQEDTNRDR